MNGDFGTSPFEKGRPSDDLAAYLSLPGAANSKGCCPISNAVAKMINPALKVRLGPPGQLCRTSALAPKAELPALSRDVAKVPEAGVPQQVRRTLAGRRRPDVQKLRCRPFSYQINCEKSAVQKTQRWLGAKLNSRAKNKGANDWNSSTAPRTSPCGLYDRYGRPLAIPFLGFDPITQR
jgi:hypothetical protein